MQTPSFLVWALARHCPLRQIADWRDPERTERLLRAARAWDEAASQGRILAGIGLATGAETLSDPAQALAFREEAALGLYGGAAAVRAACGDCEANVLKGHQGRQVVGCFGMWPLPADLDAFYEQVDAALADRRQLLATKPGWFGLWLPSLLPIDRCGELALALASLPLDDPASAAGRQELAIALEAAARGEVPLHVRLYPPGRVEGPWWHLAPHCGRCKAPWPGRGNCRVCGQTSPAGSPKKRHVRGQRPYFPLVRLLGGAKAGEFLARYRTHRSRRQS